MRKFLLYSSALVLGLSGAAEAACIQTPTCSSLGYTSSSACDGGIKCPFGNAWNCTAIDKITELETQITELKKEVATSNCLVGDILYSDKTCSSDVINGKTPIGVVFDRTNRLAIALEETDENWSKTQFNVPELRNISSSIDSVVLATDKQGKYNTKIVLEYCKSNGYSCPAFEYVNSYKTEGTQAGDWYLPAVGELYAIYGNSNVLDDTLGKMAVTKLTSAYWSSSESSTTHAWGLNIASGSMSYYEKNRYNLGVRPVLAF